MSESIPHSLSAIPLLAPLTDAARAALEQRCRWQNCATHEQIIGRESESRDVYFVVDGRVRVVNYSGSGREIAFDEHETGAYFGELAAVDSQPRSATVVAITDTLLASISPDTFVNLLHDYPDVAIGALRDMAGIVRASTDRIMELSTLGVQNRVHSEILREARLALDADNNTARISPAPVHADIASRVSTTRETVARVLSDLSRQELVIREGNDLVVRDVARLETLVRNVRES